MPCLMNEQTKILNCKLYDASGRASGIFLVLMMRFGAALGLAPWRHLSRSRHNPSLREPGGVAQRLENTSDDDFPSTSIIHDIISSLFSSSSSFPSNPIPLCFFATGFLKYLCWAHNEFPALRAGKTATSPSSGAFLSTILARYLVCTALEQYN